MTDRIAADVHADFSTVPITGGSGEPWDGNYVVPLERSAPTATALEQFMEAMDRIESDFRRCWNRIVQTPAATHAGVRIPGNA
ncbi:hypothetical protein ABZ924_00375 [Streptomyces sp. NPDC046876]|uniref:hypothetical protein n=1 Tax=Streptomyces sp. NPDC046876 TaxID=3155616 RepID=UPI0033DF1757